jgi:hypothetical protein
MPNEIDEEFLPLPYYPYESRPVHIPVDVEEAATALYLDKGVVDDAASRLRIPSLKLQRMIDRSPRLTRLHKELVALLNDRVLKQVISAFDDPDNRRREWASAQVIRSEAFRSHPLAPSQQNSQPTLNIAGPQRIVISWDDGPEPSPAIEHDD